MGTLDGERLRRAIGVFEVHRTPGRVVAALQQDPGVLEDEIRDLDPEVVRRIDATTVHYAERNVVALFWDDPAYPRALSDLPHPPPVLFAMGDLAILRRSAVGMCGSRHASPIGLEAARACGLAVAKAGLTVISGYATGVDTATHIAALDAEGQTVVVLAEGFNHFRVKATFHDRMDRVLVLSQFPPNRPWDVGAAMTRNGTIAALGRALVVIEAKESGGTLDAGLQGLAIGRPVLALEFESGPTPMGNRLLIEKGAIPISTAAQLQREVSAIADPVARSDEQLALTLG
jgi:DNA processing protein